MADYLNNPPGPPRFFPSLTGAGAQARTPHDLLGPESTQAFGQAGTAAANGQFLPALGDIIRAGAMAVGRGAYYGGAGVVNNLSDMGRGIASGAGGFIGGLTGSAPAAAAPPAARAVDALTAANSRPMQPASTAMMPPWKTVMAPESGTTQPDRRAYLVAAANGVANGTAPHAAPTMSAPHNWDEQFAQYMAPGAQRYALRQIYGWMQRPSEQAQQRYMDIAQHANEGRRPLSGSEQDLLNNLHTVFAPNLPYYNQQPLGGNGMPPPAQVPYDIGQPRQ